MTVQLTQGNIPPLSNQALIGEQIKPNTQSEMLILSHEEWSNAGQSLGGLYYHYQPARTTSTTFNQTSTTSVLQLDSWVPLLNAKWLNNNGDCKVIVSAFIKNAQIRFSLFDYEYGLADFVTLVPSSGTPQWVQSTITISSSNIGSYGPIRVGVLEFKRDTFDTEGLLYNVGAKVLYRSASDIPR